VNLLNSSEGTLISGFIEADIDGKFSSQYDLSFSYQCESVP